MADRIILSISMSKDVASIEEGKTLYELVKLRLADRPDVTVRGSVSTHFEIEE